MAYFNAFHIVLHYAQIFPNSKNSRNWDAIMSFHRMSRDETVSSKLLCSEGGMIDITFSTDEV